MATNNLSLLRNFLNTLPNNSIYSLAINGIGKNDIDASYLFNNYQNLNKKKETLSFTSLSLFLLSLKLHFALKEIVIPMC